MRRALVGLGGFIATPYVARHRYFARLDITIAPDDKVVVVASQDDALLGVLNSTIHTYWADAAGTRLGVGNDSTYNNPRCFDAFPFCNPAPDLRDRIAAVANRLDAHRSDALGRDERVTMTDMYNVVAKLRSGAILTPAELVVHELAACGVLRDLHDELDSLVAEAYQWPWPIERDAVLERLVALHAQRLSEEEHGAIRWLRPDFQIPRFAPAGAAPAVLDLEAPGVVTSREEPRHWPSTAVDQLGAIGAAVSQAPRSVDDVVAAFAGARKDLVTRHLETLAMMGEIALDDQGRYHVARRVA
jgi:hypothetical protein